MENFINIIQRYKVGELEFFLTSDALETYNIVKDDGKLDELYEVLMELHDYNEDIYFTVNQLNDILNWEQHKILTLLGLEE